MQEKKVLLVTKVKQEIKGTQGNASVVTDASAITSGVLNASRVPNLDASKITGGELNASRIPLLDPDKIRGTGNLEYTGKVNLYEDGKQTTEIHHGGSISMGSDLNSNSFFGVFSGKPNQSNMLMNPLAIGGANGLIPSGSKLWVNGNVTVNGTVSAAESMEWLPLERVLVNNRWSVVYANSGDIVTSDQRLKSDIRELSEVEKSVAKKLKSLVRIYQKNDSIEEKGEEKADFIVV